MPLMSARRLADHATGHGSGVPSFAIPGTERHPAVLNPASACVSSLIPQTGLATRDTSVVEPAIVPAVPAPACLFPGIPFCPNRYLCQDERVGVRLAEAGLATSVADESLPEHGSPTAGDECNDVIVFRVAESTGWIRAAIGAGPGILGLPLSGEVAEEEGADLNGSLAPMAAAA